MRRQVVPDFSPESWVEFVKANVGAGSGVVTEGCRGYDTLCRNKFVPQVHEAPSRRKDTAEGWPNVHHSLRFLTRWLLGTPPGAVRPKPLQPSLDAFAFRENRRHSRHVGKRSYRLLQGAAVTESTAYWKPAGRTLPNAPLPVGPTGAKWIPILTESRPWIMLDGALSLNSFYESLPSSVTHGHTRSNQGMVFCRKRAPVGPGPGGFGGQAAKPQ